MATIGKDGNGRRRILFVAADGGRKTVRLGKCSQRDAEQICRHVEGLAAATVHGQPVSRETAVWLAGIGDTLHDRLVRAGLVGARAERDAVRLGAFLDDYLATRTDVKPSTMLVKQKAKRWLIRFLGEDRAVTSVTPGDADAYRAHLRSKGRARATANKWCYYAKHFFAVAVRRRLIVENPFAHIKGQVKGNPKRRVFVPGEQVQRVIDAAPDPQWKLLIALARWGGVRVPSEPLALRWQDVDFEHQRFTVHASKKDHHEGEGIRVVPMFPELVPHFHAVFDDATEGAEYVITRYRDPAANLRTQLVRYIEAAGLTPWVRPWQNLRVSRATELADHFPSHVCAAWLGHSEKVADEFYRQVTDEHFLRATSGAAQNPAQQLHEMPRNQSQPDRPPARKPLEMQAVASGCDDVRNVKLGAAGFEPATEAL